MKNLTRLQSTLKYQVSSLTLTFVFAVSLFSTCNTALAQGTALGPFTDHDIVAGPAVLIGSAGSPMPIDLDPAGQPWTKGFFDPNGFGAGNVTVDVIETIENVGTESWDDWHEHIIGDPQSATAPSFWSAVLSLEINGNPITFIPTGVGTKNLWLDQFSQPVQPGDILTIHKQVDVFNTAGDTQAPLVRMEEYPTPVPEPATCLLMVLGLAVVALRRS